MPVAIQSLFAIIAGTSISFCPDSPRWYYAKGRLLDGDQTLARLYGIYRADRQNYDDHFAMQETKSNIFQNLQLEAEQENRLSWVSLIWDNTPLRVGRRIRISFMILSIQQMMGIDILVYYLTLIFSQVGLSSFTSSLLAAISLTIQFGGSLLCIPTIERLGRRKIMLLTSSVQFCCMLVFVVLNGLPKKTAATEWAAAIIMLPYLFMYGWGWVACPWYVSSIRL
jgi:Na+/melibiose symporter-like transporter